MYDTLKLLHVLAVMIWLGGGISGAFLVNRSRRATIPGRLALGHDLQFLGKAVYGPSSMMALLFGVWMVIESGSIGFGDAWIVIGLGGMALSVAFGTAFLGPTTERFVAALERGDSGDALLTRLGRIAAVDQIILAVVVWAMVVKPGA